MSTSTAPRSQAETACRLARTVASVIPGVPATLYDDSAAARQWENLMLEAAHGIAAVVGYDREVLRTAVGPDIEVGVNPPWRALLQVALIVSTPAAASADQVAPLRLVARS